ncbi:MFS transporter [Jatrophihabitans sp. DSM 45814]
MSRTEARRITFTDVLRIREYRMLWLADAQSSLGDQLARVALTILVYDRTGSAALTSSTYALTFLPALLGGVLLSGIADRVARRTVLVVCDLIRAVLLAFMAMPSVPLVVVCVLLVFVVLVGTPFSAAQASILPDILDTERYPVAVALRSLTGQLAQLAGFAGGGLLIAAVGPRTGLFVDAVTFVLSAAILRVGLNGHPAGGIPPAAQDPEPRTYLSGLRTAARLISRNRRLRSLLGLAWLVGLYVIPEGIAAPFAASVDGGTAATGIIMAAAPAGTAVGAFLLIRLVSPEFRRQWVGPMAAAAGLPLVCFAIVPNVAVAVVLLFVSGVLTAYLIEAMSSFTQAVPTQHRGQVVGLASSGFLVAQGAGLLLAGIASEHISPSATIAIGGAIGTVLALGFSVSLSNLEGRHSAASV